MFHPQIPLAYWLILESGEPVCSEDTYTRETEAFMPTNVATGSATIIHPLSDQVKALLNICTEEIVSTPSVELTQSLAKVLINSHLIWQSKTTKERYIAKCTPEVIVKSIEASSDFTEYTSLQYLELHGPQIPVPRPHGLITSGKSAYLFMSFVPGVTLEKIWPELQKSQKESISSELDSMFSSLRQLHRPDNMALGGVAGEGCKDTRRHTRISEMPLHASSDFWDFQYCGTAVGSETYLEFLRRLTSPFQTQNCVFTHGDVRKENIIVQPTDDGECRVNGIIDWEMSGFYPEDFECTKVTNTFATNEMDDWYLNLPTSISPANFPSRWLADRVWDRQIVR